MSKSKDDIIFLSDIDGVAADWLEGFIKYCESIGHVALHNKPAEFGMTDIFPTLEKPWEHIMDYQHSEFYEAIKAYPEAISVYNKLHDMGVKIIFVTSCGLTDQIINARTSMIKREFNNKFHDIEFLELGASKKEVLSKYPNATFVDDQMVMAIEGDEAGHKSFIKNMSYNLNDHNDNVERLMSFSPLIKYFAKELSITKEREVNTDMACN